MTPDERLLHVPLAGIFSDPDLDPLTYSVTSSEASIATASVINVFEYVEIARLTDKSGVVTVTITATDGHGASEFTTFTVTLK